MGDDMGKRPLMTFAADLHCEVKKPVTPDASGLEPSLTEEATLRLIHELEVCKADLELQNQELRHALEELRMKEQMLIFQDRLAVMGEMINNIAHQWRQPLNKLGLVIQQLPIFYDTGELSREFIESNAKTGMELIQNMSQTIDDFRTFFKADKEAVEFSVNQVIRRALSLMEKSFNEQNISIALRLEDEPMAKGYPNEYAQVLLNILMNARDAKVGHRLQDVLISIHTSAEEGRSIVTITDNAGGVAEEIMDKLFDPYFTTKGSEMGTGIGLFISKTIIEKNMGGSLTVRNTGNGAEFRIVV